MTRKGPRPPHGEQALDARNDEDLRPQNEDVWVAVRWKTSMGQDELAALSGCTRPEL
jgi:hypothetical protein